MIREHAPAVRLDDVDGGARPVGRGAEHLDVLDDGVGVPEGWSIDGSANLGLRIASTLVESELSGQLEVGQRDGGGTRCTADLPLPR